jgi:hypothetical protein
VDEVVAFLQAVDNPKMTAADRAVAALWFASVQQNTGLEPNRICDLIQDAGHPAQNRSRLVAKLAADKKRVSRVPGSKAFRLHPRAKADLDQLYTSFLTVRPKVSPSDSVLPHSLFHGTRGYIEKVVSQINASFDLGLFDCCAVMCRRLLETLIIEVYEASNRSEAIKRSDGHFHMFSDLMEVLLTDKNFNVSRNAQQGLKEFKRLGDLSAHSRRYNAHQSDIERVRQGVRVASEELLHMARLI